MADLERPGARRAAAIREREELRAVAMRCGGLAQVGDERFAPPWAE